MALNFFNNWMGWTNGWAGQRAQLVLVNAEFIAEEGIIGFGAALLGFGFWLIVGV